MTNSDEQRDPLEVLFSEFLQRKRSGDAVQIEEFALEHPSQASEIRELFPTLAALEKARSTEGNSEPFQAGEEITGGQMMGEYRLLREIGVGGMGIVYEAMQESIQRRVALKVLPQEFTQQESRRDRFLQEARTVAKLSYRNIVPIFDFGKTDNRYFFAMRLIRGAGLDWIILRMSEEGRPVTSTEVLEHFLDQGIKLSEPNSNSEEEDDSLACEMDFMASSVSQDAIKHKWTLRNDSWKQIARIGLQAGRALNHAHQVGIFHRDIKPGNILLDEDGIAWITDFGLAKSEHELSLTAANDVVGTLRYISPERFHGQIDARSDIYALGLTLIELCIHRPVFESASRSEMIRNIMEGNITPPREINPEIPEALERILLKATAKNPAKRYQAAEDFVEDLRAFSRGNAVKSASVATPGKGHWLTSVRNNWLACLLTGLCLIQAAALLTVYGVFSPSQQGEARLQLAEDKIQSRLEALDSLYQQVTQRNITDDLDRSLTISRTPDPSNERNALRHLLPLFSQLHEEAQQNNLPIVEQQVVKKIKLLNRLLK